MEILDQERLLNGTDTVVRGALEFGTLIGTLGLVSLSLESRNMSIGADEELPTDVDPTVYGGQEGQAAGPRYPKVLSHADVERAYIVSPEQFATAA